MEWLTAAWSKINNPLAFLFVGAALFFFAPPQFLPFALVSGAIGLAGAIQWIIGHATEFFRKFQKSQAIKSRIATLNNDERMCLLEQITLGHQTFYLNWHDYHGAQRRIGSRNEYPRLFNIYTGLAQKGFLLITTNNTIATLHIPDNVWRILQKKNRTEPEFLHPLG